MVITRCKACGKDCCNPDHEKLILGGGDFDLQIVKHGASAPCYGIQE